MAFIHGETVTLITRTPSGVDPFGVQTTELSEKDILNVLVSEPTTDDIVTNNAIHGKQIQYVLCIPKGDTNNWTDAEVIIRGEKYMTVGYPTEYTEANVPLSWNKKVKVARYG